MNLLLNHEYFVKSFYFVTSKWDNFFGILTLLYVTNVQYAGQEIGCKSLFNAINYDLFKSFVGSRYFSKVQGQKNCFFWLNYVYEMSHQKQQYRVSIMSNFVFTTWNISGFALHKGFEFPTLSQRYFMALIVNRVKLCWYKTYLQS